jgi:hypothetical protein
MQLIQHSFITERIATRNVRLRSCYKKVEILDICTATPPSVSGQPTAYIFRDNLKMKTPNLQIKNVTLHPLVTAVVLLGGEVAEKVDKTSFTMYATYVPNYMASHSRTS